MATSEREMILRGDARAIGILVASEEITITEARYAPGESVAGAHVHAHHTDAFYAPEGGFAALLRGVRDRVDV